MSGTVAGRFMRGGAISASSPAPGEHVAYLVGLYPALSQTFIAREIEGLRAGGLRIDTVSLHRTPEAELLTEGDRREAAETFVIQPPAPGRLVAAHAIALARSPRRYVHSLARALRLSPGGWRANLWHLFYFGEAILLWHELARRGIRHVHVHFANAASAVALVTADYGDWGWSWSFTMHGPTEFDDVTRFALAEKVRSARFVACIGDYARSQLMKLVEPEHWRKLGIVRCGLDTSRFAHVDRTSHDPDRLSILCVGRLVVDKGQAMLLEALASLHAAGHEATLTLVGDGPNRRTLERRAAELGIGDRVTFAGSVGQDRIRDLYGAADVFCLPSFAEGIPVVLMEAMATGLPVVTTQIMGIPELVTDGVSGTLVPPGRVDALVAALAALAEDREAAREMGAAGRRRVQERFEIRDAVEAMRRLMTTGQAPTDPPADGAPAGEELSRRV